jgi:hypothetical protein
MCILKANYFSQLRSKFFLCKRVYKEYTTNKESYLTMQLNKRMVFKRAMQAWLVTLALIVSH